jgi:hypothetical protein
MNWNEIYSEYWTVIFSINNPSLVGFNSLLRNRCHLSKNKQDSYSCSMQENSNITVIILRYLLVFWYSIIG